MVAPLSLTRPWSRLNLLYYFAIVTAVAQIMLTAGCREGMLLQGLFVLFHALPRICVLSSSHPPRDWNQACYKRRVGLKKPSDGPGETAAELSVGLFFVKVYMKKKKKKVRTLPYKLLNRWDIWISALRDRNLARISNRKTACISVTLERLVIGVLYIRLWLAIVPRGFQPTEPPYL